MEAVCGIDPRGKKKSGKEKGAAFLEPKEAVEHADGEGKDRGKTVPDQARHRPGKQSYVI